MNANGVPLFFDKWDIAPGDSLVEKIFREGLAHSQFFFVVLSQASVNSRWVKEELDVATVRRVEGFTRVVPLLMEDCDIPLSLRSLRCIDMRKDFDAGVHELTKLVYGINDRPALGPIPLPIQGLEKSIGGLSREASTVGRILLQQTDLDAGSMPQVGGNEIQQLTKLTPQEINDAVDELEVNGLAKTIKWLGTAPYDFGVVMLTSVTFREFAEFLDYDPNEDIQVVIQAISATGGLTGEALADQTGLSPGRLNRAVDYIDDYGLAQIIRWIGTVPYSFGEVRATPATRQTAKAV